MKKIAVIGTGSAGIQSLCTYLRLLDNSWEIYSIYSPEIPILGIGESSNPIFLSELECGLDFLTDKHIDEINGTLKFGTRYIDWRKNTFTNPLIDGSLAIHFDTNRLKDFAIPQFKKVWKNKFKTIEGKVTNIKDCHSFVSVVIDDEIYEFDFVVDCTGSPDLIEGDYLKPKTLLNACLVHNNTEEGVSKTTLQYTDHIATPDGWMFVVPLPDRISYGYLFNDTITPQNLALKNFSKQINVPEDKLQGIEYHFEPYMMRNSIQGRIIRNGNSAGFIEPMFANSLFLYGSINTIVFQHIINFGRTHNEDLNGELVKCYLKILNTIAFHYLGGSTYSTDFWEYAKNWGKEILKETPQFERYIKELGKYTKSTDGWRTVNQIPTMSCWGPLQLRNISRNLEYNYM